MNIFRSFLFGAISLLLATPLLTSAQDGPLVESGDPLKNAANNFKTRTEEEGVGVIQDILLSFAEWLLIILGVIAVIMALVSAYKFMTAGGNEEQIEEAKKTLTWALVGVLVAIISLSIVTLVDSALTGPTTGGSGLIEIIEPFI